MKKTLKLLILVLSLALIFGAIAIVASADAEAASEPVTLTQAMIDSSNGTISFESDMKVTADLTVGKNLTLDLNGYKLTVDSTKKFTVSGSYTFTVNGPGEIECGLFVNADATNSVTLNINGKSDEALSIYQKASSVQFSTIRKGTVNVNNVYYTSDSAWKGGSDYAVFGTTGSAGVKYMLKNSTFTLDKCGYYAQKPSNTGGSLGSNSFILIGTSDTADIDGCVVNHEGHIFNTAHTGT